MATKHSNPELCQTPEQNFIASIDLAILGSDPSKYNNYAYMVRKEYFAKGISHEDYRRGRIEFLENMLKRDKIYLYEPIYNDLEDVARANIRMEINRLEFDKP